MKVLLKQTKRVADRVIRMSSRLLATRFAVAHHQVLPARTLTKQLPPKNRADLPSAIQAWFVEEAPLPDQVLHELTGVRVSWHGVVVRDLQLFVPSIAHPTQAEEFLGTFLVRQWLSKTIAVEKVVGLVYDHWAYGNYYHWLIDSLPRLLLLRKQYPDCVLLMPAPVRDYMALTTAALGFTTLQPIAQGYFARVQKLIVPSHVAPPGKQDPVLMRQLRQELTQGLASATAAAGAPRRRLYVSRSKQRARRLANEQAVTALLAQHAIETVYFEDMSFEQQVAAMQNVELLIGVHGANLTNMLFLASGAKVVELLNQAICNPCYFHLASNLDLAYYAVPCAPVAGTGDAAIPNSEDILVDIAFLTHTLTLL